MRQSPAASSSPVPGKRPKMSAYEWYMSEEGRRFRGDTGTEHHVSARHAATGPEVGSPEYDAEIRAALATVRKNVPPAIKSAPVPAKPKRATRARKAPSPAPVSVIARTDIPVVGSAEYELGVRLALERARSNPSAPAKPVGKPADAVIARPAMPAAAKPAAPAVGSEDYMQEVRDAIAQARKLAEEARSAQTPVAKTSVSKTASAKTTSARTASVRTSAARAPVRARTKAQPTLDLTQAPAPSTAAPVSTTPASPSPDVVEGVQVRRFPEKKRRVRKSVTRSRHTDVDTTTPSQPVAPAAALSTEDYRLQKGAESDILRREYNLNQREAELAKREMAARREQEKAERDAQASAAFLTPRVEEDDDAEPTIESVFSNPIFGGASKKKPADSSTFDPAAPLPSDPRRSRRQVQTFRHRGRKRQVEIVVLSDAERRARENDIRERKVLTMGGLVPKKPKTAEQLMDELRSVVGEEADFVMKAIRLSKLRKEAADSGPEARAEANQLINEFMDTLSKTEKAVLQGKDDSEGENLHKSLSGNAG